MAVTRSIEFRVVLNVGPLQPTHDPFRGSIFTGYSPVQVGHSVSRAIMEKLQAGERIQAYDVRVQDPGVTVRELEPNA